MSVKTAARSIDRLVKRSYLSRRRRGWGKTDVYGLGPGPDIQRNADRPPVSGQTDQVSELPTGTLESDHEPSSLTDHINPPPNTLPDNPEPLGGGRDMRSSRDPFDLIYALFRPGVGEAGGLRPAGHGGGPTGEVSIPRAARERK
jgi:hypothetical protein